MQTFKSIITSFSLMIAVSAASVTVNAEDWVLDQEGSSLSFVSTKLTNIAEVLGFDSLSGGIDSDGKASVSIDVESLNTGLELRDQRMKEFLFNAIDFPEIEAVVQIEKADLAGIKSGETKNLTLPVTFKLLGKDHSIVSDLFVTHAGDALLVSTAKPIVLNAAALGLVEGVAKLAELAGGISIGQAVPVSFNLRFVK